jgi:transcription initiation factor TFIIIB Brf1 subunit/transcription initiation factor TFIIB
MHVPDSMNYVPKIVTTLELPREMQTKVLEALQKEKDYGGFIIGRDPPDLAAGSIYIASNLTENQVARREITFAAGATEVPVRNWYKEPVREL